MGIGTLATWGGEVPEPTRSAVFIDRDGVLTEPIFNPQTGEYESAHTLADLRLCPNIVEPLRSLACAGFALFIVSNQPSYAKGKVSLETLQLIARAAEASLRDEGIVFTETYYCYHHPMGIVPEYSGPCVCRKPAPFFLLQAQACYDLDLSRSWMIGDRDSDVECGQRAGCRTIRVAHPRVGDKAGTSDPDYIAADLAEAVERILVSAGQGEGQ